MANTLADLDQHDVARVRAELVEVIAASFAYPAFFDYTVGTARIRPPSAARRQEITQFVQAADLGNIERLELDSASVRRFLERLFARYIEANSDLARAPLPQRVSFLRVLVPRVAAEAQRSLLAFAAGAPAAASFGAPRPRQSWQADDERRRQHIEPAQAERSAKLIQTALLRRREPPAGDADPLAAASDSEPPSLLLAPTENASALSRLPARDLLPPTRDVEEQPPAFPWIAATQAHDTADAWRDLAAPAPADGSSVNGHNGRNGHVRDNGHNGQIDLGGHDEVASEGPSAAAWAAMLRDMSGPVPAIGGREPPTPTTPFAGLDIGTQSGIFGALPSNPFSQPGQGRETTGNNGTTSHAAELSAEGPARDLPPGLVEVYASYLRALQPQPAPPPEATLPAEGGPDAPTTPTDRDDGPWNRSTMPPVSAAQPLPVPPRISGAPVINQDNDRTIFEQLRNQLTAYLYAAARTAGVPLASTDPAQLFDALRRAGKMSEADLRLAANILAIADRILAGGTATQDDYRQAFMLYLLYHRGRAGA